MKRKSFYIVALSAIALCACQKDRIDTVYSGADGILRFSPSVFQTGMSTKSQSSASVSEGSFCFVDGALDIPMSVRSSEGISFGSAAAQPSDSTATKGALLDGTAFPTTLAFFTKAWTTGASTADFDYTKVLYRSTPTPPYWITVNDDDKDKEYLWKKNETKTFYAYANLPDATTGAASISCTSSASQTLTYTVPSTASAQTDILMGYYSGNGTTGTPASMTGTASIVFSHPLTAVQFKLGTIEGVTSFEINSISIEGVYSAGVGTMTPESAAAEDPKDRFTWEPTSDTPTTTTVSQTIGTQPTTSAPAIGEAFLLIPQTFESTSSARIVLNVTIDGTKTLDLYYPLASRIWKAGYTNEYTIGYDVSTYTYSYIFAFSDLTSALTQKVEDNVNSVTKGISINSYRVRDDAPEIKEEVGWKILSYKVDGGETVIVGESGSSFDETDTGLTVSVQSSTNTISVTASGRGNSGMGTHDYWINKDGISGDTDGSGWSPADWSSTRATASSPLDLSKFNYQTESELSGMTTANCYVIRHAGTYKIPLVYGNAMNGGNTNELSYYPNADHSLNTGTDARTNGEIPTYGTNIIRLVRFHNHLGNGITDPFIENNTGCAVDNGVILWQSDGAVVKDLELVGGTQPAGSYTKDNVRYLQFTVDPEQIRQNVTLIAIRDASGKIMWSWQIWTTNDPAIMQPSIEVKNHAGNSYNFFPLINIGHIEVNSLKERKSIEITLQQEGSGESIKLTVEQPLVSDGGFNALYQFGRKDPTCNKDDIFWYNSAVISQPISVVAPYPEYITLADYIKNPCTFYAFSYYTPEGGYLTAVYPLDNPYRNLWSGKNCLDGAQEQNSNLIKTVYDPSPIGYKVPAGNAFTGFTTTGGNLYSADESKVNGYEDARHNMFFYRYPETGQNGGTIRFSPTNLRVGLTGEISSSYANEGWYYCANTTDNQSRPVLLNFEGYQVKPTTSAAHNAHAVRPVIDVTMTNNPIH